MSRSKHGICGVILSDVSHRAWCRRISGQCGSNANYVREYILKIDAETGPGWPDKTNALRLSFTSSCKSPPRREITGGFQKQSPNLRRDPKPRCLLSGLRAAARARHQERAREKDTNRPRLSDRGIAHQTDLRLFTRQPPSLRLRLELRVLQQGRHKIVSAVYTAALSRSSSR